MDYRINGAGSYGNPFAQAFQRQPNNPFQLPRVRESDESSSGVTNYGSYLGRANIDKTLQARRNQQSKERPDELRRMMEMIQQREMEIAQLRQQVAGTQNPDIKQMLEAMMYSKTAGFSSLQGKYNQQFKGIASGFVGSENRIDHIGSFVTLV